MTVAITADELIQRNARFAAAGAFAGLPFPSNQTLRVLGCVDSRVDPSHVLGLDLGEAIVMRNIGGRVTPAVLRSWRLLAKLGQQEGGGQPGGGAPHLGGSPPHRLRDQEAGRRSRDAGRVLRDPVSDLDAKAVSDPHAAVRIDVDLLGRSLPAGLLVSGLVYDTDTGLVEVVVPPTT